MPKTGILLIHGTFGSPHEYAELESLLRLRQFHTHCITLPGHGDWPDTPLSRVKATHLLQHCQTEYHRFREQCKEVVIVGHSLGGMCALILASQTPKGLKGLVTLGAPYDKAFFVNYPWGLLTRPLSSIVPGIRYAPHGWTGHKAPLFMPWWLPTLQQEAGWLMSHLKAELPSIDVPVCMFHSPYDMIVPYEAMQQIADRIAKPEKTTLHTLRRSGHQVFPTSPEKHRVTQLLLDYLNSLELARSSHLTGIS